MKNNTLEICKFFAIVSVLIAHYISDDFSIYSRILQRLGTFGVPFFLFLSGYFFNIEKYGFVSFYKNKFKNIIVPWLFTGTIVYLVVKRDFDFLEWGKWIIGVGTYLYYLSVLILLFLLFSLKFFRNKYVLIFFVILNCLSLLVTYYNNYNIYSYLNLFNWVGFFSLGILFKGKIENIISLLRKYNFLVLSIFTTAVVFITIKEENDYAGYFSKYAFFLEIIGGLTIMLVSSFKFFDNKIILLISKFSFSIYLVHFLFFPIKRIVPHNLLFEIITPVFLAIIISYMLYLGQLLCRKLNIENLYVTLLGIK